jgi:hypothetical protein
MKYPIRIANTPTLALCCLIPAWVFYKSFTKKKSRRRQLVSPSGERVLILGASSGVGRVLALKYAERGAKVCVIARRDAELELVRSECELLAPSPDAVFGVLADFTDAEALITVRNKIEESEFGRPVSGPALTVPNTFSCQSGMVLIHWSFQQAYPLYVPSWR